jgi:hypothetical protein
MREVIPHTRRERVSNYGDSAEVHGSEKKPLITLRKQQGDALLLTVQCETFSIPKASLGTADFRPMVHVTWGHGGTTAETNEGSSAQTNLDLDVTYRQRFPVAASTLDVECFIAAFPKPSGGSPVKVPDTAVAKFRGFVSEGVDGLRLFASRWVTQLNASTGVFARGQSRLASVRAFNPATAGSPVFFLLFDQDTAPTGGEVPFDGAPLPLTNPTTGGLVPIPMGETRAFTRGIAWGVSSTPFSFTAVAVPVFATAELQT